MMHGGDKHSERFDSLKGSAKPQQKEQVVVKEAVERQKDGKVGGNENFWRRTQHLALHQVHWLVVSDGGCKIKSGAGMRGSVNKTTLIRSHLNCKPMRRHFDSGCQAAVQKSVEILR